MRRAMRCHDFRQDAKGHIHTVGTRSGPSEDTASTRNAPSAANCPTPALESFNVVEWQTATAGLYGTIVGHPHRKPEKYTSRSRSRLRRAALSLRSIRRAARPLSGTPVRQREPNYDDDERNDHGENSRDFLGHPNPEHKEKQRDQQEGRPGLPHKPSPALRHCGSSSGE